VETVTADDWEAFYTAQLGAAAALGGLVFVGLSLNLKKILSYAWLPGRALLALMVLMAILIISSFMLMPGQSLNALGIEIAVVGVLLFLVGSGMEVYALRKVNLQNQPAFIVNLVLLEFGILPFIVGSILLLLGIEGGFYWIAAGVIVSFIKAVTDAWVLLVEVNR
jgi:modulator of FtsH protease